MLFSRKPLPRQEKNVSKSDAMVAPIISRKMLLCQEGRNQYNNFPNSILSIPL